MPKKSRKKKKSKKIKKENLQKRGKRFYENIKKKSP